VIHPHTELRAIDDSIGHGLFATKRIPRGTITWTLDALDQRFSPERLAELGPDYTELMEHFAYPNGSGDLILCWDLARWMNHSCNPTALSTGWDIDFALRDIEAGEQLTTDYASLNVEASFECLCGEPSCRGTISAADFEPMAEGWDKKLREAAVLALSVDQPLWSWVANPDEVRAGCRNPETIPSILAHRAEVRPRSGEFSRPGPGAADS
jgi:hypothetical protein